MDIDEYNSYCGALPKTTTVVQWRGSHVWKVGGKVFAIARHLKEGQLGITFKASEFAYEILRDTPGLRPAPYMASRGLKWIQHYGEPGLPDGELKSYLNDSYHMAVQGLTKKQKTELGLEVVTGKGRPQRGGGNTG